MLDQETLKRRIHAARLLRGLDQEQLNALFEADGLGKTDAGRIERGTLTMQRAHREAFVRNLQVPEDWFLSENVDELVGWVPLPRALEHSSMVIDETNDRIEIYPVLISDSKSETPERDMERAAEVLAQALAEKGYTVARTAGANMVTASKPPRLTAEDADPDDELRRELEGESPTEVAAPPSGGRGDRPAEGGGG